MVIKIFKFENRTSDGENFCRSGEMTLQYISYSTDEPIFKMQLSFSHLSQRACLLLIKSWTQKSCRHQPEEHKQTTRRHAKHDLTVI